MPSSEISFNRHILRQVLSIPTAPFAEHLAVDFIRLFCGRRNLSVFQDVAGNLSVRVRQGRTTVKRPVCLTAHLDHPGFVANRMMSKKQVRAFWRGGVPEDYFVGSAMRFYVNQRWVKGKIRSITTQAVAGKARVHDAVVDVPEKIPRGSIGMWDFPDPRIRGQRIYARACDDLAGVAAMLCCIDELVRSNHRCDAYFLFTRAEEVGFVGAIAACRLETIPKKCIVIAMETSSQLSHARMGDGPVLRVGDRASTFSSQATAYCHRVARDVAVANKTFRYQRKLMDGGTCESSAYCALGYEATGICLALGNYHNVDVKQKKLAPEYIDLNDFDHVVKWFVELARAPHTFTGRDEALDRQLGQLERAYGRLLYQTVS